MSLVPHNGVTRLKPSIAKLNTGGNITAPGGRTLETMTREEILAASLSLGIAVPLDGGTQALADAWVRKKAEIETAAGATAWAAFIAGGR